MLAAISCIAGVVVMMVMSFREHKPENLFVNQIAAKDAENKEEEKEETQQTEEKIEE